MCHGKCRGSGKVAEINCMLAEHDSFESTVQMFSASRLCGKKPLPIEISMCLITKFGEVDNKFNNLATVCAMHRGKDLIPNNSPDFVSSHRTLSMTAALKVRED